MQIKMKLASESHVPRFRAGVGTWRSRYMIPIRLPWRHRARPSATLHEILSAPKGKLVLMIVHMREKFVNRVVDRVDSGSAVYKNAYGMTAALGCPVRAKLDSFPGITKCIKLPHAS